MVKTLRGKRQRSRDGRHKQGTWRPGLESLEVRRALSADGVLLAPDLAAGGEAILWIAPLDPAAGGQQAGDQGDKPLVSDEAADGSGSDAGVVVEAMPSVSISQSVGERGEILSVTEEIDKDNDGTLELRQVTSYTYDSELRLTSVSTTSDYGADGTVDATSLSQQIYNAAGQLSQETSEYDSDGDGVANGRNTTTFRYDDAGNLENILTEVDENADGVIDFTSEYSPRIEIVIDPIGPDDGFLPVKDGEFPDEILWTLSGGDPDEVTDPTVELTTDPVRKDEEPDVLSGEEGETPIPTDDLPPVGEGGEQSIALADVGGYGVVTLELGPDGQLIAHADGQPVDIAVGTNGSLMLDGELLPAHLMSRIDGTAMLSSGYVPDADGDGDSDILTLGGEVTTTGNGSGGSVTADSAALATLIANFTGALQGAEASATASQGDWDGDGDVDSADLLELISRWSSANSSAAAVDVAFSS